VPRTSIDPWTRGTARRLRRDMTDAERLLWRELQSFRVHGARFRRQAPIGPYIADFAWLSAGLVIEVDGGQHAEDRRDHDRTRDAWLRSRGFEVVRLWNTELIDNPGGVRDLLFNKIVEHGADPTPPAVPAVDPPRKGEGIGRRRSLRTAREA
jgi:very-short-patch-repair endonuclease